MKAERRYIQCVNRHPRRNPRCRRLQLATAWIVASLTPIALLPLAAFADDPPVKVSATGQYEYNSNIFDISTHLPVPGTSDFHHGDSYYAYGSGIDLNTPWQQQDWYANALVTGFKYDHFTQLDHTEYKVDGGLKWRLGYNLQGQLEVQRSQSMVPFTAIVQSQLSLATEQRETASLDYQFAVRWRLEGSGYADSLTQPSLAAPKLLLSQSQAGAALNYLGATGLTSGVSFAYQYGVYSYTNGTVNPSYDQTTGALFINYAPTIGLTTLEGAAGFTRRASASGQDDRSGLTGHLLFTRKLTGKTFIDVTLDRIINNYVTNAGSEIDTSASTTLTWQATYRIALKASYIWTYSLFPAQGYIPDTNRGDHLKYASLKINYDIGDWLTLKPYANVGTRLSNYPDYGFNSTIYGVQFVVRWPGR